MKAVLFCNFPYSFSILSPIANELLKRGVECLWYIPEDIIQGFANRAAVTTSDIRVVKNFQSDLIFVPGNLVPWFLRGVKIQIFHGLAGEKKGHFRIRQYFDLYLTQGPYFTNRFNRLAEKHKNFKVVETGWSKLDKLYQIDAQTLDRKKSLLAETGAKYIVLFAPTFSPSLTSANTIFEEIIELSTKDEITVLLKFHDKHDKDIVKRYKAVESNRLRIISDGDITESMKIADLMISDTSSVVYEFTLLHKPVVTLNSQSQNIHWQDISSPEELVSAVETSLSGHDEFKNQRQQLFDHYHPYNDARSSERMVDASLDYIDQYGVPEKRCVSLHRKYKIMKKYGLHLC